MLQRKQRSAYARDAFRITLRALHTYEVPAMYALYGFAAVYGVASAKKI